MKGDLTGILLVLSVTYRYMHGNKDEYEHQPVLPLTRQGTLHVVVQNVTVIDVDSYVTTTYTLNELEDRIWHPE